MLMTAEQAKVFIRRGNVARIPRDVRERALVSIAAEDFANMVSGVQHAPADTPERPQEPRSRAERRGR